MNYLLNERARRRLASEIGTVTKNSNCKLRIALAYPNRYYIGMSNVGFQAVYHFWNQLPDVVCERVFLPDPTEITEHRRTGTPLFSLESQAPVRDFDVLAFSVTFEPDELNLIQMLDLARIPPLAQERDQSHPLILAGGPITFLNPEPMAPFLDVVAVGEAEALLVPLTDALRTSRSRGELFDKLKEAGGFYLPSCHQGGSNSSQLVRAKMGKRADLPPPATYILTSRTEMSNKFLVEVSRGCPTLCRFCWAGYNYLPKRSFQVDKILEVAHMAREHTSSIGLVSTAVGAHKEIVPLAEELRKMKFRISVASLRFEDLRAELLDPLVGSGERTLAVAPEVGTDRLRFAIHKRISNQEIFTKIAMLFERGVENLKLYLMIGLPGERHEDLEGIVQLVDKVRSLMLVEGRRRGRLGRLIPSINPFIPKAGTPFQWHGMEKLSELNRKVRYLQKALGQMPNVEAHFKSPRQERLQALLAVGDRRLAPAMIRMARGEADLKNALAVEGLDLSSYIYRQRALDEVLPWGYIDNGMKPALLESQYEKALRAPETPIYSSSTTTMATA